MEDRTQKSEGNPKHAYRREEKRAKAGLGNLYQSMEAERRWLKRFSKNRRKHIQVMAGLRPKDTTGKHFVGGHGLTVLAMRMLAHAQRGPNKA